MSLAAELESLTRDYGREIFARLHRRGPLPFTPAGWDEQLMEFTMSREAVDALPLLHTPETINRHLREYFRLAGQILMIVALSYVMAGSCVGNSASRRSANAGAPKMLDARRGEKDDLRIAETGRGAG